MTATADDTRQGRSAYGRGRPLLDRRAPKMTPRQRDYYVKWWLQRSGLSPEEVHEIARRLVPPDE